MCTEEYISYQCGHRSMSVVRPCPMTTAGHNFPVCSGPLERAHVSETMCCACERQLHSRWVLIREWEHRWMHERGVCGCKVVFPGLLTTPRVTGESGSTENLVMAEIVAKEVDKKASSDVVASDQTDMDLQTKNVQTDTSNNDTTVALTNKDKDSHVPALFTEGVSSSGEPHVVVRLPGLYAAEWHADHAALHKEGKCSCNTDFRPFTPRESEEDMSPQDKETLRKCREANAAAHSKSPRGTDRRGEDKPITMEQRIAEIKEEFGEFEVEGEIPEREQAHKLPNLIYYYPSTGNLAEPAASETPAHKSENHKLNSSASAASTLIQHFTTTEAQIPAHETVNRRLDSASNKTPRKSTLPAPHPSLPPRPKTPTRGFHHHQLTAPSKFSTPSAYRYQPTQPHLYPPTPSTTRVAAQQVYNPNHNHNYNGHNNQYRHQHSGGVEYTPSHRQQHYYGPTGPAYSTPSTYSDGIPFGAYPWAAQPQQTPGGKPWVAAQGPGPYRTPGVGYTHGGASYSPAGGHNYAGNGGGQGYYQHNTPGTGASTAQTPAVGSGSQQRRVYTNSNISPSPNPNPLGGSSGNNKGNNNSSTQQQQHPNRNGPRGKRGGRGEKHTPLCGLPIGAGPEGVSHMPSWSNCPLHRRSASAG
ncbi:hypothetical protein B0J18DRAFT_356258, partial [Chaetomium sp. MPI-SDFR-AT-0129]